MAKRNMTTEEMVAAYQAFKASKAARNLRWYEKVRTDPEYIAKRNERNRRAYQRRKAERLAQRQSQGAQAH